MIFLAVPHHHTDTTYLLPDELYDVVTVIGVENGNWLAKAVGFTPHSWRKFCGVHKKQSLNHKIDAFLTATLTAFYTNQRYFDFD